MKISACYIVKNEELVLEKSLKSLKNIDEIIIVDTGSIDNTINIARKYNAQVYDYVWNNDFAAARNYALQKVTGDWIVFMDADEYFTEDTMNNLRSVIEANANMAPNLEQIFVKRLDIDTEHNNNVLANLFVMRIFKNKEELIYKGKIHEALSKKSGGEFISTFVSSTDLCLYHTGYSSDIGKQKAERNLNILLDELEVSTNPSELYMYLAEAYEGVGNNAAALEYALKDVEMNGRMAITYASRSYRILFRLSEDTDGQILLKIARKAVMDFPELPEFWAQYAVYLSQCFIYSEAITAMKKALECFREYNSIEPTEFSLEDEKMANSLINIWKKTQELEKSIFISACVITKNEASEIPMWIENMKLCSDEQILIDTGSTDETVAIAQNAGIKTYYYEWDNNFSNARNAAIEKAKGDWVLFLDADESFSADTVINVRSVIAREHLRTDEVDVIFCPILNIDVDDQNKEIQRFMNIRLFRNVPELRYQGNVHESVRRTDGPLRILKEQKKLVIYHTGYSSKKIEGKLKRNLELLQEDIKKNGEGMQHYRYLLDCYYGLGDYEKAIQYAKLYIQSPIVSVSSESDIYRKLIFSLQKLSQAETLVLSYIDEAITIFPCLPDFYGIKGFFLSNSNRYGLAKKYLKKAIEIYESNVQQAEASAFESDLLAVKNLLVKLDQKNCAVVSEKFNNNIDKLFKLEENRKMYQCGLQNIGAELQNFFRVAFKILNGMSLDEQNTYIEKIEQLLPLSMFRCLMRYIGHIQKFDCEDYEIHCALLKTAILDESLLLFYEKCTMDFEAEAIKKIAKELYKLSKSSGAIKMLLSLPSAIWDVETFYLLGQYTYENKDYVSAKKFFWEIQADESYKLKAESYLQWISERENGIW